MTVKEASQQVGMSYDSLAELLRKYPSVRLWLGAWREKGAWVYPDTSLHQFEWMAARHAEGWTLAAIAKGTEQMACEQEANALVPSEQTLEAISPNDAPISQTLPLNEQTARAFADLLRDAMIAANDDLWTLKEAKERYPAVPLSILRQMRVQVGRRYFVKRSAVLKFLADL